MNDVKLLLVDDEKGFIESISRRLTHRNFQVQWAFSGIEALEKLDKNKEIEVVILDVKMPQMDGIEALEEIKKAFPLVEVIMLTGHATVETAIEGMKRGAFDYLMKPCDIEILMEKVREAGRKKRSHEEKIVDARIKEITNRMA